jgi:hypothetical protein
MLLRDVKMMSVSLKLFILGDTKLNNSTQECLRHSEFIPAGLFNYEISIGPAKDSIETSETQSFLNPHALHSRLHTTIVYDEYVPRREIIIQPGRDQQF